MIVTTRARRAQRKLVEVRRVTLSCSDGVGSELLRSVELPNARLLRVGVCLRVRRLLADQDNGCRDFCGWARVTRLEENPVKRGISEEVGGVSDFIVITRCRWRTLAGPARNRLAFTLVGGKSWLARGPEGVASRLVRDVRCGGDATRSAADSGTKQSLVFPKSR